MPIGKLLKRRRYNWTDDNVEYAPLTHGVATQHDGRLSLASLRLRSASSRVYRIRFPQTFELSGLILEHVQGGLSCNNWVPEGNFGDILSGVMINIGLNRKSALIMPDLEHDSRIMIPSGFTVPVFRVKEFDHTTGNTLEVRCKPVRVTPSDALLVWIEDSYYRDNHGVVKLALHAVGSHFEFPSLVDDNWRLRDGIASVRRDLHQERIVAAGQREMIAELQRKMSQIDDLMCTVTLLLVIISIGLLFRRFFSRFMNVFGCARRAHVLPAAKVV